MPKKQYLSVRAAALALSMHSLLIQPLAISGSSLGLASVGVVLSGCAASSSEEEQGRDKFVFSKALVVPLALTLAQKGAAFLWTVAAPLGVPFLVGVVANFALTPIWEWYFRGVQSLVAEAVKPPPAVGRYASLSVTSMATFLLNQGAFANGGQAAYDRYIGDINKVAKLPTGTDAETIAQLREVNHRYGPASAQAIDRVHQALSFLNVSQFNDLWGRWVKLSDAMTSALPNHTNQDSWASEYQQQAQQLLGGFSQDHGLSAQQATNLTQAFVQTPGVDLGESRLRTTSAFEFDYEYYYHPNTRIVSVHVELTPNDRAAEQAEALAESAGNGDDDVCKRVSCRYQFVPDVDTAPNTVIRTLVIYAYSWASELDEVKNAFCGENLPFNMLAGAIGRDQVMLGVSPTRVAEIEDASANDAAKCKTRSRVWWFLEDQFLTTLKPLLDSL